MGIQSEFERRVYNWGVRQRNKWVKSKTKTKTAIRVTKDVIRVGKNVIDSYNPPEVDPFTGIQMFTGSKKRRRKR